MIIDVQKGSAQILLILAALVILILGGLYFYKNNKNSNLLKSPKFTISKVPEFKDYSNPELGFEFKYSKDLSVKVDTEEEFNKRGNGDFRKNFAYYVTYQPAEVLGIIAVLDQTNSYETNPLTIWVFNNDNNLTIEKWYTNFWYYPFVWGDYTERRNNVAPTKDATISGILAKSGVVTYQPGTPKFIYISKNGKMYLFRIIGNGDQILASLKML